MSPVAGPLFRAAAKVPLDGDHQDECRKLLCLIAAYFDADAHARPSVRELAARMKFEGDWAAHRVEKRLRELHHSGVLVVGRPGIGNAGERNRYALKLDRKRKGGDLDEAAA